MIEDIIIIGVGDFDLIRIIDEINADKMKFNLIGFTDIKKELIGKEIFGYPVLGDDSIIESSKFNKTKLALNVYSTPISRSKIIQEFNKFKDRFCNIIHPSVNTKFSHIGIGNIIYDYVVIQSGVKIGDFNIIYSGAIIAHESIIGNNCLISINSCIGARNKIGDFCHFGISSSTIPNLEIEDFCFIGAGSLVLKNLKNNSKVFGNPARLIP